MFNKKKQNDNVMWGFATGYHVTLRFPTKYRRKTVPLDVEDRDAQQTYPGVRRDISPTTISFP